MYLLNVEATYNHVMSIKVNLVSIHYILIQHTLHHRPSQQVIMYTLLIALLSKDIVNMEQVCQLAKISIGTET